MDVAKPVAVSAFAMSGNRVKPLPLDMNPKHVMSQQTVILYTPLRPGGRFKKVSPDTIRLSDLRDNFIVDHEMDFGIGLKSMEKACESYYRERLADNLLDFAAYAMLQEQLKQPRGFRQRMAIDLDQIKSVLQDPGRELKPGAVKPSSPKLTR